MQIPYVALLRGINVSGHHKVSMAELKEKLELLGFEQVKTLLNSGNVIFSAASAEAEQLEQQIESHLAQHFGFPVPTIIRTAASIKTLYEANPFQHINMTKQRRRYVSFFKSKPNAHMDYPWVSEDGSFEILKISDQEIFSLLDLSKASTPQAMDVVEKFYGKTVTTRNWNTIERIIKKL